MTAYVLRRLAYVVPVLIGVSLLAFGVGRLAPGDPARDLLFRTTGVQPTEREVAAERHRLGFDKPLVTQYVTWVGDALRGRLGTSYATGEPVGHAIAETLPRTLELAAAALLIAVAVAVPLGVLAAAFRWTWVDHLVRVLTLLAASMPTFWVGYLLILVFAVHLHLLPPFGTGDLSHLVLPACTLALFDIALLARFTRAAMLEVIGEDYVRTARAKGLSERRVLVRHVLRNALIPVVTWTGMALGFLLGYSVVVETVFAWPGLGYTTVQAIGARDYPYIQAFALLMAVIFVTLNLIVDLLYTWIDPRVRFTRVQAVAHGAAR